MACVRKKMKGPKERIVERLDEIREQRHFLVTFLDEKLSEAETKANRLLKESEKSTAFMQNYSKVMKDMDECLSTFVVISATIPEDTDKEGQPGFEATSCPFDLDVTSTNTDTDTKDWHNSTSIKEDNQLQEHCDIIVQKNDCQKHENQCLLSGNLEESTSEKVDEQTEKEFKTTIQVKENTHTSNGQASVIRDSEIIEKPCSVKEAPEDITSCPSIVIPEVAQTMEKSEFEQCLVSPIVPHQESEDHHQLSIDEKAQQGLKELLRQVKKEHKKEKKSKKEKLSKGKSGSLASGHSNTSRQNESENASVKSDGKKKNPYVLTEDYGLGPNIPKFDVKEKDKIEVMVTEVMSPTLFWSQISPDSEIHTLMESLGKHHEKLDPTDSMYHFDGVPKSGTRLSSRFTYDDKWYRALATKIHGGGGDADKAYADVFYVDYGNTEKVEVKTSLRPLLEEFAKLPAQAVPCAMSGISPPDGCKVWSPEQCLEFANLVVGETPFHANYKVLPGCPLLFVELFRDVKKEKSIANELIQKKLASKASNEFIAQLYSQNISKFVVNGISMHEIVLSQSCKTPFDRASKINSKVKTTQKDLIPKPTQIQNKNRDTKEDLSTKLTQAQNKNEDTKEDHSQKLTQVQNKNEDTKEDHSQKPTQVQNKNKDTKEDHSQKPTQLENKNEDSNEDQSKTTCLLVSQQEKPEEKSDALEGKTVSSDCFSAKCTAENSPQEYAAVENKCVSNKRKHKIKTRAKARGFTEKEKTVSTVSSLDSATHEINSNKQNALESLVVENSNTECSDIKKQDCSIKQKALGSHFVENSNTECPDTKKSDSYKLNCMKEQQGDIVQKDGEPLSPTRESDTGRMSNQSSVSSTHVCKSYGDSEEWNKMTADDSLDQILEVELSLAKGEVSGEPKSSKELCGQTNNAVAEEKPIHTEIREISADLESQPTKKTKLKEYGLPHTLPEDCDFKGEYDSWMKKHREPTLEVVEKSVGQESKEVNTAVTKFKDFEISFEDTLSISFLMSHIENPNYFFIHLVNENSGAVEQLMIDLNEQYGRVNDLVMQRFFDVEPSVNDICCAKYSEDNRFYRAYILGMREISKKPTKKKAVKSILPCEESDKVQFQVLYIDFGNSEWVERSRIFPLLPKFTDIPPQAVPCTLITLQPPYEKEQTGKLQWSRKACESFVEMTGYMTNFVGFLIDKDPMKTFRPTVDNPLPIDIVDTTGETDRWISEDMVRLGLAEFVVFPLDSDPNESTKQEIEECCDSTSPQDDLSLCAMDKWNPMEQEYHSIRNSYQVDITDPGVAMFGYKAKDRERICRFYNRKGGCWRGQNCPLEHSKYSDDITSDKAPVFCVSDTEQLALPEEGTWLASEVTAIFNPAHFYVTFPFGTKSVKQLIKDERSAGDEGYEGSCNGENIETLMQSMGDHYDKIPFRDLDLTLFALGEIIAAKFSDDGRWYRAKVINTDPDNEKVEVFYVDFGNTEWVSELDVRQMQAQFMHLPFQAIECFLPLSPNTKDGKWTAESKTFFKNLVDGQVLIAKVLSRDLNGVICVDLYNTDNEEVFINQVLIDKGFAKLMDSKVSDSTSKKSNSSRASSKKSIAMKMLPG